MAEYIDRVALLRKIRWADTPEDCIFDVRRMPLADVAPVVRGRWIPYPDCGVTKCSHCAWIIEECWESNYCPNCGAKMDLED